MATKKYIKNPKFKLGCIFPVPKLENRPKKSRFEKFFIKYSRGRKNKTMSMQLGSDEESLARTFNSLDLDIQDELSRNSSPISWGNDKLVSEENDNTDVEEMENGMKYIIYHESNENFRTNGGILF